MQTDRDFVRELAPLWEYLAPSRTVGSVDAIFVFGGIDMLVPRWAATLWGQGVADAVLVSGNAGALTHEHFSNPEAVVFAEEMVRNGVPDDVIVRELTATNTGENVSAGVPLIAEKLGLANMSLALVAKPFLMRRCLLTFERLYPSIAVIPSPPPSGILASVDRGREAFAQRLVAEFDRLDAYADRGFIATAYIPDEVRERVEEIRSRYQ